MYNKSKCMSCKFEKEYFHNFNDISLGVPEEINKGFPKVHLYDILGELYTPKIIY